MVLAAALLLALPSLASATPAVSAPPATNTAPVISWVDTDLAALSWTVSRGPDCSSLTQIDPNATSPVTDASLALNGSDDGSYCYEVESFDGADPSTSSLIDTGTATVILDTTGPPVSFASPPSNNTRVNGDTDLDASATDALTSVASVQLQRFNGSSWVDVGTADTSLPFTAVDFLTATLPDASYPLRLEATDALGNTDVSSQLTLILDTVTAATAITAPADGSIETGTFGITFTNADPATPVVTTATARAHGTTDPFLPQTGLTKNQWATTAVNDGDWDIRLSSVDSLGNLPASADTVRVIVDNTDPLLTLTSFPTDGDAVRGTVNVTFTTSDAVTPPPTAKLQIDPPGGGGFVDATTTPITGGLAWNTTSLAPGLYGLQIVSTDGAGNATVRPSTTVTVKVDNTAPALPVISPSLNGAQFGLGQISVAYTGGTEATSNTASGLASVILQTQNQSQVGSNSWTTRGLPVTTSPVKWTPLQPDDCLCNFRLIATDNAGNQSVSALATNISIDGFRPVTPAQFRIDRPTTNGPPILTWTASGSGDVVGYRLVRARDQVVLQGPSGLLPGLRYTDVGMPRNGSADGANGYDLYAVDRHNNASDPIHVNFFLDTVPPTTPTSPRAARRGKSKLVDVSWGGSQDIPGNTVMTGVSRYVVRRAVGAAPATATSGESACDVPVSQLTCTDIAAGEGKTYAYSVFAVDGATNGSLAAHAGSVTIPDLTPPGAPSGFKVRKKGLIMALSWTLPRAKDLRRIVIVKSTVHAPRTLTDGKVVFSGKAARANVRQAGGTRAWYRTFAVDNAGNASAGSSLLITQPKFRLFPENGSEVRGSVGLRWRKSKRASYYNVQVYLGSKRVTQGWPKGASFKVPKSKLKRGKVYTWYVWPGIGAKARGRYGNLIGKSTFTWLG